MAQKLIVNCATCDARNICEETYAHYASITIHSAALLTSPEGKAVMSKLPVTLDCANVVDVAGDVHLRTINGRHEITPTDVVSASKYYLVVNGVLTIHPHTQKQLEPCVGMTVNGSLICPESMYAALPYVNVNGSNTCYPDGAIVLPRNAVIDNLFALRAKKSVYWSAKRMIMVDPQLDGAALRSKGASFRSGEIIIAQSKVEQLLDLLDEQAQLTIVPDHTAVILDDVTLDEITLRRYGTKLYVVGDVTVPQEAGALGQLEYLNVRGDIKVPQEHKETLLSVLTQLSGELKLVQPTGTMLKDQPFVRITKWMLEQQPTQLQVSDCAVVQIADDVPKEWIAQRLRIQDCAVVKCSQELEDAVTLICTSVAQIGSSDENQGQTYGGAPASDTQVIHAAQYVL